MTTTAAPAWSGVAKIVTCNTILHCSNDIDISRLVAAGVAEFLTPGLVGVESPGPGR